MNPAASPAELRRLRSERFHRGFFWLDVGLCVGCLVGSLASMGGLCSMAFFGYFTVLYLGQAIQHFLCYKMPRIDIVSHNKPLLKYLAVVSAVEISYFLVAFLFWTKSEFNPIYCFVVRELHLPFLCGIIFILHFIASLFLYIQVLHDYITRKYYLLALGGFSVEQRLIRQREESLRQMGLIEPFYNEYPAFSGRSSSSSRKSYQFNDIFEELKAELVCSICLTRDKEGHHPIYTPCKHFFHRECIEDWAKINNKCPQCRTGFTEMPEISEIIGPLSKIEEGLLPKIKEEAED